MELADLVVVTKADGDLAAAANHAAADLRRALHLLRPKYRDIGVEVQLVSSTTGSGVADVWTTVQEIHAQLSRSGDLEALRRRQALAWMWDELRAGLLERFRADPAIVDRLSTLEAAVADGSVSPTMAARELLGATQRLT